MTDLLSQLARATEGSRELDALVFVEISRPDCTDEAHVRLPNRYDYEDGARPGDYWLVQRSGKQLKAAPHYTTNLQDAVSLVPEGWFIDHLSQGDKGTRPANPAYHCRSILRPYLNNDVGWLIGAIESGESPTMALALCIAIIKAHESSKAEAA